MFPIRPPDDPFLINTQLFGLPIQVRWYGVLIVSGALLAGWLCARRAERRGYNPEHIWNLLMLGMLMGIAGARAYYVIFEWSRFEGRPILEIINPQTGGLAIHGGLIGSFLATIIYTRYNKLPLPTWVDICAPGFLLGQAIGRWGNFFNQEAYGRPTDLPFGVVIDADHRLEPYTDLNTYPPNQFFHATFLYESLWNFVGVGLLLLFERRMRGWRRPGDLALGYAIWYGLGRLWIEGFRTDSLCTSGIGGSCEGALRTAQVVSIILILIGVIGMIINHRRATPVEEPIAPVETSETEEEATVQGNVETVKQ